GAQEAGGEAGLFFRRTEKSEDWRQRPQSQPTSSLGRNVKITVLVAVFVVAVSEAVFAQTSAEPCAIGCPSPALLDSETCSCKQPATKPCALVCPPDETLDAEQCACIKSIGRPEPFSPRGGRQLQSSRTGAEHTFLHI